MESNIVSKYFRSTGMVKGIQTIGGKQYYFDTDGSMVTNIAISENGIVYSSDVNGVLTAITSDGWVNNTFYIQDGKMVTGWKQIDGKSYYFNANGACCKNVSVPIDGKEYYFDGNGVMQTGWIEASGARGTTGTRYYAKADGTLVKNSWAKVNGVWYYFGEACDLLTGIQQINGAYYSLDVRTGRLLKPLGNIKDKWVKNGINWYYFNSEGNLVKRDTLIIAGKQYAFDDNGKIRIRCIQDGIYYGSRGVAVKNQWISVGLDYYYADVDGKLSRNEWKRIGGVWY